MAAVDEKLRRTLIERARSAIARAIGVPNKAARGAVDWHDAFPVYLRAGAFVTLRIGGHLRGCIGYPDAELPLLEVVERCAASAALSDPRFPPLSVDEWPQIDVEISVLGPIEPVSDISEVEVGRHGLIVDTDHRRGLLLPQVATEWKWDATEFARQTCAKAGLPRDAWQKGARLYKFEAEVFGE